MKGDGVVEPAAPTDPSTNVGVGRFFALTTRPDSTELYVAVRDADEVAIVDHETQQKLSTIAVGRSPRWIAAKSDGKTMYVVNYGGGDSATLSIVDTINKELAATVPLAGRPGGPLAVTENSAFVVCGGHTIEAIRTDLAYDKYRDKPERTIFVAHLLMEHYIGDCQLAAQNEGQFFYLLAGRTLHIFAEPNSGTRTMQGKLPAIKVIRLTGKYASGLVVAPNGRYVYAATKEHPLSYLSCVDLHTKEIAAERTMQHNILTIVMSKSGRFLYCIATEAKLMALNMKTNTFAAESVALPGSPAAVALSNDGQSLHLINEQGALHTVALPSAIL
jgi:YVTN family beta-propeller protein